VQGNLDFTMINIHAASPKKTWRPAEIRRLKTVYESVQASDPNQNDVFLVGDFNTPVNKIEWDDLKGLDSMSHILTKDDKTTIYKKNGMLSKNQYDTFWYQSTATDEDILPDSGQVLMAWNVTLDLDPEKTPPDSITDEDAIKRWHYSRVMSDHLPVMIVLRTDQDTDHFVNN
jgi:endonuclease/exonuclease/phosphatase family metal-dependent hydrolase